MYRLIPKSPVTEKCIVRLSDGIRIPFDDKNGDYQAYLKWLEGYELINGEMLKTSNSNQPIQD